MKSRTLQAGTNLLEVNADFVAVARVIDHDKQNRFFAERLVFGKALFPFFDAQFEVVVVSLGENGKLFDIADDFAEVGLTVRGFTDGLRAKRREKVIAQVFVLKRRVGDLSKKHAVDVGEKKISRFSHHANVVLEVKRYLKIIAPVAPFKTVVRQDWLSCSKAMISSAFEPQCLYILFTAH